MPLAIEENHLQIISSSIKRGAISIMVRTKVLAYQAVLGNVGVDLCMVRREGSRRTQCVENVTSSQRALNTLK